ncbi:hypothetical protein N7470_001517 [Penicillium chermesinum]|nr:hypothetical protein N7470_001517 [Penicillium chermesinum]
MANEKKHRGAYPHRKLRLQSGNFAPVKRQLDLQPCQFSGTIPVELHGGQYVRNGGNPSFGDEYVGDRHLFDGDGMLSGIFFQTEQGSPTAVPYFVNRYILTDLYLAKQRAPLMPSIATLAHPAGSSLEILYRFCRLIFLIFWSHVSSYIPPIRKFSVGNTAIIYHDKRALATCQTGPPIRVHLPNLETVGWYNGYQAENENSHLPRQSGLGCNGLLRVLKDWTTSHPRVDRTTGELISFQASFFRHSFVPGITSPKFMHDFGVSRTHTVVLDLPVSLDMMNMIRGRPVIHFDGDEKSRFGIFPRRDPSKVRWYEAEPCFIFHTAATWDGISYDDSGREVIEAVNMVACRYTRSDVFNSMGCISSAVPESFAGMNGIIDCQLYYYQFSLLPAGEDTPVPHQWALSAIPVEMPVISPACHEKTPRFVYGCSSKNCAFGTAPGEPLDIDCLVKFDIQALIERGIARETEAVVGCVDIRTVEEILADEDADDPIKIFKTPEGWYTEEPQFVPRIDAKSEDDGYLIALMFDQSQLDEHGMAPDDARSELWVIDARDMKTVATKIFLPQRVPYGFHGNWFNKDELENQRSFTSLRRE